MSKLIFALLVLWQPIIIYPSSVCHFLKSISTWDCSTLNLTNLPINEIRNHPAKILDFGGNYLKLSPDEINQLSNLPYRLNVSEIRLNDNRIEKVPESLSDALPNLKKINLQNNDIKNIKINQFKRFTKLQRVCLDNNLLEDIKFENLTKMLPDVNFTCPHSNGFRTKINSTNSKVPIISLNNSDTNGSTTKSNPTDSVSELPISLNNSDKNQTKNIQGENSNSSINLIILCVCILVLFCGAIVALLWYYLFKYKKFLQNITENETTVENANFDSNLKLLSSYTK